MAIVCSRRLFTSPEIIRDGEGVPSEGGCVVYRPSKEYSLLGLFLYLGGWLVEVAESCLAPVALLVGLVGVVAAWFADCVGGFLGFDGDFLFVGYVGE